MGPRRDRSPLDQHTLFTTPEWTRDGRYILVSQKKPDLYKSSFEMWEYDINGGSGVQITKSNANDTTPPDEWKNAMGASVSPDGRYLYYAHKVRILSRKTLNFRYGS